jgi:hypothetical protein
MTMKLLAFSVFDSKAEVYGTPIFFATKGLATRAFEDQCNKPDSPIAQHPGDYTLFCIGDFDTDTGMLTPLPTPAALGTGVEYKRSE